MRTIAPPNENVTLGSSGVTPTPHYDFFLLIVLTLAALIVGLVVLIGTFVVDNVSMLSVFYGALLYPSPDRLQRVRDAGPAPISSSACR